LNDHDPPLNFQLKISRASFAGVPAEKIAAYLRIPLEQVEATIVLDRQFRAEEAEFAEWIAANTEKQREA
jgi:hypothetical protein